MATGITPTYLATGKENALYSLFTYIAARFAEVVSPPLPLPVIIDMAYEQTITYPCVMCSDVGLGQLADKALGRRLGPVNYGRWEQTLVEFEIQDMNRPAADVPYNSAELNVRRIRDQLKFILQNAAMIDQVTSAPAPDTILPTIHLLDHNNSNVDTGSIVWHPRGDNAAWNESFLKPTDEQPNLKRYRCTARINWILYEAATLPI